MMRWLAIERVVLEREEVGVDAFVIVIDVTMPGKRAIRRPFQEVRQGVLRGLKSGGNVRKGAEQMSLIKFDKKL